MSYEERFAQAGENGKEFRGAPFWSWNDDLDPDELRRQIRSMCNSGMGGYFMHARIGLLTPYLGQKYMECHEACIDEGRELGMGAWLYDEDCWPSGSAGGITPAKGPFYQAKVLDLVRTTGGNIKPDDSVLGVFTFSREGGEVTLAVETSKADLKSPDRELFLFQVQACGYIDVMKEEAVAQFIDSTHKLFRKLFKPEFGITIPGIFTDEPNYSLHFRGNRQCVPWTDDFAEEFKTRRGYDILPKLPAIFYKIGDDWRKVRHDFWRTATELYVEAFSKQIGQWCENERFALTGHQLLEDSLALQISVIGAAMPHYEHMQVPGIDHLARRITDPILCKQVSSVAQQLGGRRVLSEMFGVSGWNMSFEDQKWIAEWQYVLGVNLMCQHLALYSLKGCRKRDFPPSIFYQQPWWPDYKLVEDHFARLSAALTSGKHVADVLVIHPIESAWCMYNVERRGGGCVDQLNEGLANVSRSLQGMHVDYHYGDESIMERQARIESGKIRVGEAAYSLVVIPPSISIRTSTLELLKQWIGIGGTVIVVGEVPALLDGEFSDAPLQVLKSQPRIQESADFDSFRRQVMAVLTPRIEVLDSSGADAMTVYHHQRDLMTKQLYFLVNTDNKDTAYNDAVVRIRGRGAVEEWDLDTGEIEPLACRYEGGCTTFELRFEPTQSHLIAFNSYAEPQIGETKQTKVVREQELGDKWDVEWLSPNALTLDYCRYKVADGRWSGQTPTIWLGPKLSRIEEETPVTVKFTFNTEFQQDKHRDICLVMERPEDFQIKVNGRKVVYRGGNWWTDISFKMIDIDSLVRPGKNIIELRCDYLGKQGRRIRQEEMDINSLLGRMWTNPPNEVTDPIILPYSGEVEAKIRQYNELKYGLELESIYITGDFGVHRQGDRFVLGETPAVIDTGDLVEHGAPFFRGTVLLKQIARVNPKEGGRVVLKVENPGAIVTKVRINGENAGTLIWRPMELDITNLVKPGDNTFEFEMTNSCRNLLGPHHHKDGELTAVGPGAFLADAGYVGIDDAPQHQNALMSWTDEYSFVPTGLPIAPKLVYVR